MEEYFVSEASPSFLSYKPPNPNIFNFEKKSINNNIQNDTVKPKPTINSIQTKTVSPINNTNSTKPSTKDEISKEDNTNMK